MLWLWCFKIASSSVWIYVPFQSVMSYFVLGSALVVFDARSGNTLHRFGFGRLGMQLKSPGFWYFALCVIRSQCSKKCACSSGKLFWEVELSEKGSPNESVFCLEWFGFFVCFECDKLKAHYVSSLKKRRKGLTWNIPSLILSLAFEPLLTPSSHVSSCT